MFPTPLLRCRLVRPALAQTHHGAAAGGSSHGRWRLFRRWQTAAAASTGNGVSHESKQVPPLAVSSTPSEHVFACKHASANETAPLFTDRKRPSVVFEYVPAHTLLQDGAVAAPEVAFWGRSNVGKSSLMNALMQRDLCRTSKTPGRTQLAYHYGMFRANANDMVAFHAKGYVVDLPGYGYAKAPKDVVDGWNEATQKLLVDRLERGVLRRLYVLVDNRHGYNSVDEKVMEWIEAEGIPYTVVLTKSDKVPLAHTVKNANMLCLRRRARTEMGADAVAQSSVVHVTSSRNKSGVEELMASIRNEFEMYRR